MKKFKKLTAGLLGAVMAVSVCSFTAFAAGGEVAEIKGKGEYGTLQEAIEAAEDGDTIVLLDDVETATLGGTVELVGKDICENIKKDITYDLKGHTLTYNSNYAVAITGEHTLAFEDSSASRRGIGGTLVLKGRTGAKSNFNPQTGASISVENINIESKGSVFYPRGNAASVDIRYCNIITSGAYCVATNAEKLENYGVIINIENSKLTTSTSDGDNTAVLINVNGKLTIKDSKITGDRQAVIARAGEVEIENTEIVVTGSYNGTPVGIKDEWQDGNNIPVGAVVVGNKKEGAYEAKANVIIEDCIVTSEKEDVPAILTEANKDYSSSIEIIGKDTVVTGAVMKGINQDKTDIKVVGGNFNYDIRKFIDPESNLVEDKDGKYVVMDDKEYKDYLDSKKPSHSYSLEEGRVDRDDKEDEKNEPVVTPEEEAGPFSDVGKDNPNYDAIIKVYENGWMAGIGDGVFAPNGTLTRGMGAMVLWNKAGCPEPQNVAPFLDVTSDDWYAKAVAWAYEQGIVAGYGDVFGPDDALTTEQFERMSAIANGKTPEIYVGGAPNATRGWVASLLAM